MQTKTILLTSAAIAALLVATAPAQAVGTGWYVSVTGGANWVDDNKFTVGTPTTSFFAMNADADTGFVIGGAVGLGFNNVMNGLRAEVALDYRSNKVDGVYGTNSALTPQSGTVDYDYQTFSVLANVWLDIPIGGSGFTPYIGGGLGWADTNADGNFTCTFGFCSGTSSPIDSSEDGFAWQAGAGVNFDISPNVKLGVGYRYFQGPEPSVAAPFTTSFAHDLDNGNHSAVVQLTFGM